MLNKRVLTHFLFWLFYVLFFGLIYGKYGHDYNWYLLESLCMLPFIMLATYTTIYVIMPYYLKTRKLILTVIFVATLVFFVALGERIFLKKLNGLEITIDTLFGVTFLYLILETNFMLTIAFAIKIVKKWSVQKEEKHEIEKRNLESELKLLKAQLHPHFLFNTMNNLYALSLEKSSKTSEGIAKISDLLRSILYECNEAEIELDKEIKLIQNFIDLEKMRYENRLKINFNIKGITADKKIAPMLLFTFIENSFKHGSRNDPENPFIKINLIATKSDFVFIVINSKPKIKLEPEKNSGGIGLENVKKRLEIIYKQYYELELTDEETFYKVHLRIEK